MINADKAREMVKAFEESTDILLSKKADEFIEDRVANAITAVAEKGGRSITVVYPVEHDFRKRVAVKLRETYGFSVLECSGFWSISW